MLHFQTSFSFSFNFPHQSAVFYSLQSFALAWYVNWRLNCQWFTTLCWIHLNLFSFVYNKFKSRTHAQLLPSFIIIKLLQLWNNIFTGKSSTCLRRSQQGFIYIYCIYKTQKVATLKMPRNLFTKNYKDGTRKVKKQPLKTWPDLFQIEEGRSNIYYSRNIKKKSLQMRQEAPYCQNFTLS